MELELIIGTLTCLGVRALVPAPYVKCTKI
jgi:hypothetical protein